MSGEFSLKFCMHFIGDLSSTIEADCSFLVAPSFAVEVYSFMNTQGSATDSLNSQSCSPFRSMSYQFADACFKP